MSERWLLIDTCATTGGVALAEGERIVAERELPERTASAGLLEAVSAMLRETGWAINELSAVGVVSGPGSFTGVRVGLAAAKGLCEALDIPMAAVSRLGVLAEMRRPAPDFVAMDAGRSELFVADLATGQERLVELEALCSLASGRRVLVEDAGLATKLAVLQPEVATVRMTAVLARAAACLQAGGSDIALEDANYVRGEQQIYSKKPASMA